MKKISVLFLLVLLPVLASAVETVEIKGIWYALDAEHSCATVVKNPYKYAGDVIIPEQVEYGDLDGDGDVNVKDHVKLSDIILNK